MISEKLAIAKAKCTYKEQCCFRTEGNECKILSDTKFKDGKCHFRKLTPEGRNEYDALKGGRK